MQTKWGYRLGKPQKTLFSRPDTKRGGGEGRAWLLRKKIFLNLLKKVHPKKVGTKLKGLSGRATKK